MVRLVVVVFPGPAALVANILISRVDPHSSVIGRVYWLSFPATVTELPLMVMVYMVMGQGSSGKPVHDITIALKDGTAVKLTAGGGSENKLSNSKTIIHVQHKHPVAAIIMSL